MKPEIKTEFNRDHYYYHRIDPTPWIPFEEEENKLYQWADYLAFILLLAGVGLMLWVWL